ncbi:phage shock protein PspA [Psychrosphaera saromensis]|uniref:Phage shock protein PspA n=1 Tax=Psychrosphaera saromensis TaxID=716813 RepID=A0A2S7UWS6_9GAMM|nr:phage shock protein PspA [Psychrosphaera saromensis]PQJ54436.1 phage shock protein PspA [Psychrosphaera saromensis]GHB59964.1 phage shock protein PspA [Psychrosphaera saromensis]GLQ14369.1 phage shock protein PspA [Psychrosphaera saromensis]
MGIFSRFADIVNANINSLLDKAEDPEKMVRLIIQEMEDTLVEVRSSSARTLADKKDIVRKIDRFQAEADDWQSKAELALSKDREDLARQALSEKQKSEENVEQLAHDLLSLDEQITRLKDEIGQLQNKLEDAKNRQKSILMRGKTASSRLDVKSKLASGKINDALTRFEQYERKIDNLEAEVESYDLGNKSLADEFAELETSSKVDSELEALKAKLNAGKAKNN